MAAQAMEPRPTPLGTAMGRSLAATPTALRTALGNAASSSGDVAHLSTATDAHRARRAEEEARTGAVPKRALRAACRSPAARATGARPCAPAAPAPPGNAA